MNIYVFFSKRNSEKISKIFLGALGEVGLGRKNKNENETSQSKSFKNILLWILYSKYQFKDFSKVNSETENKLKQMDLTQNSKGDFSKVCSDHIFFMEYILKTKL